MNFSNKQNILKHSHTHNESTWKDSILLLNENDKKNYLRKEENNEHIFELKMSNVVCFCFL